MMRGLLRGKIMKRVSFLKITIVGYLLVGSTYAGEKQVGLQENKDNTNEERPANT
jgi:hypothetical protein